MKLKEFFLKKEPVEGIALFRILLSFVLALNVFTLIPGFKDFFGEKGMLAYSSPSLFSSLNLFYFFKPTEFSNEVMLVLHCFSVVTLGLGFFTRISALVCYLTLVSFHSENNLILNSGDTALRIVLFLIIFSRAGDAFSVDRWIARKRKQVSGSPKFQMPWAQRLIQIQVSFIYLATSFYKFDGASWANGDAVYFTSRLWDFERFPVPFFFDHLSWIHFFTHTSLVIEFALGTLIWVKGFRVPVIIAGILLHLGIEYSMNIPVFELLMIVLLIGMLEPKQAWVLIKRVTRKWH